MCIVEKLCMGFKMFTSKWTYILKMYLFIHLERETAPISPSTPQMPTVAGAQVKSQKRTTESCKYVTGLTWVIVSASRGLHQPSPKWILFGGRGRGHKLYSFFLGKNLHSRHVCKRHDFIHVVLLNTKQIWFLRCGCLNSLAKSSPSSGPQRCFHSASLKLGNTVLHGWALEAVPALEGLRISRRAC